MQTEACRTAISQLLAYMNNSKFQGDELQAAINHISGCAYCQTNLNHLEPTLSAEQEDTMTCRECEEQLSEYLQAEIEGRGGEGRWQALTFHVKTCPYCSNAYQELTQLLAFASGEQGTEPPAYPTPDLSFLSKKKTDAKPISRPAWHWDKWGRLVIQFSAELIDLFRSPAYAMPGLKKADSENILYQFYWQEKMEDDLEVSVTAEEVPGNPTYCTLTIEVNILSRGGWPHLADTEVTLKRDDLKLKTDLTDAFGYVVFEGIALEDLSRLIFEIVLPG